VNGKQRLSSYKEIATSCFGVIGGWVCFFFNTWILLGAPILYMVLAGSNLQELTKGTAGEIGLVPWSIICCTVVAIPFILVVVIICLVMACIDLKTIPPAHHDAVIWNQFPIALSTISFSFGGNSVYPHVEASMKKPSDWPKVVVGGLSTCACLYFLSAIPGYYVYGDQVLSPVYNSISDGVPKIIAIVVMTFHVSFDLFLSENYMHL
jgi:vesicular inhibitory amino acid transporter